MESIDGGACGARAYSPTRLYPGVGARATCVSAGRSLRSWNARERVNCLWNDANAGAGGDDAEGDRLVLSAQRVNDLWTSARVSCRQTHRAPHGRGRREERLGPDDAWKLARAADDVYVAKGKKVIHFDMAKSPPSRPELLAALLGPSGNLRAPTMRAGKILLVGFGPETFARLLGWSEVPLRRRLAPRPAHAAPVAPCASTSAVIPFTPAPCG